MLLFLKMASTLARRWKLLCLGGILFLGISAGLIISIPLKFEAQATVLFTSPSSNSGGGALSLLKGAGLEGAGLGSLLGKDEANLDQAASILESNQLAFWAFKKFRLDTAWRDTTKPDSLRPEDILKLWKGVFKSDFDDKSALELSYTSKSPILAAEIVDGVCTWLDSMTKAIQLTQTKENLAFVEQQLALQSDAFDSAERRLLTYQQKNRILSLPDQVQASVEGSAKLEGEAEMAEIQARTASSTSGMESSEYRRLTTYRDELRREAKRMLGDPGSAGAFQGFDDLGKLADIASLQREVLGRKTIYTFLSEQREQLLIESRKTLPTIFVLDHPFVPKRRSSPPRRTLFYLAFVIWGVGCSSWILISDALKCRQWSQKEVDLLREIGKSNPLFRRFRKLMLRD